MNNSFTNEFFLNVLFPESEYVLEAVYILSFFFFVGLSRIDNYPRLSSKKQCCYTGKAVLLATSDIV